MTTLSIRLPKELADDVAAATYEYRCWFDSEEEFVATAISYVLKSIAEDPPTRNPQKSGKASADLRRCAQGSAVPKNPRKKNTKRPTA